MKIEKISPEKASEILCISPESIRISMMQGELPIGHVRKSRTGKSNVYDIYLHLCLKYVGLDENTEFRKGAAGL